MTQIGSSAVDLFVEIVASLESIETVNFILYEPTPPLAERSSIEPADLQVTFAGETKAIWIPSYELLYARHLLHGGVPHDLLDRAAEHHSHSATRLRRCLPREQVSHDAIRELQAVRPGWAVAVASSVRTADGERHIPMVDFQCPVGDLYRDVLLAGLTRIGCRGALLESGASYHFYGRELLTRDEWRKFIGYTLLLSPFVDTRYVGHRLIDGESVLRIEPHPTKPVMPRVVALVR
jgi:hypothetical protein